MNNQGNKEVQKENEKSPESKLKDIEDCDLNDRELKIAVLKKLNEMQEYFNRQFNDLKNRIIEQYEYLFKEIETIKKNQIEILELNNSIKEMKDEPESLRNRAERMEEKTSDTADRNLEMTQVEEERKLRAKKRGRTPQELSDSTRKNTIRIIGVRSQPRVRFKFVIHL